jgi:hypothetical protein
MDLSFFNGLTEGDFGNALPLCASLAEGDFWTRRSGCLTVYRGKGSIANIDFERIVIAITNEGLLTLPDYITHEPGNDYYYAVRRTSQTGKQEKGTTAIVRLALDDEGERKGDRPNKVRQLKAEAAHEGRIQLCWFYWPMGAEAVPDHFAVYGDNATGTVDYEKSLCEIPYKSGCYFYQFLSEPGSHGQRLRFSVRAVSGDQDDGNKAFVEMVVNTSGPPGVGLIVCQARL